MPPIPGGFASRQSIPLPRFHRNKLAVVMRLERVITAGNYANRQKDVNFKPPAIPRQFAGRWTKVWESADDRQATRPNEV